MVAAVLRDDAPPEAVANAVALARAMDTAPGAAAVLVGRTPRRLVVATWLDGRAALEPFAASAPHMAFVMRGVAPVTTGVWSASVELAPGASLPAPGEAEALWAFALHAQDGVYEWQVRRLLADVAALPGHAAAGATVEERERLRAAGVVSIAPGQIATFERALDGWHGRWGATLGAIDEAFAPLAPEAP